MNEIDLPPERAAELRRAEALARKINLLLDSIHMETGQRYDYQAIHEGTKKAGYFISRSRWSLLKNGKVQYVPEECLLALATVFGVNPRYLLLEDSKLPEQVEVLLPQLRIKRLSEVRDFAARALAAVAPEALYAITKILDEAIGTDKKAAMR